MPLLLLVLPFLVVLLAIVLMPLTLVQRYRMGTATRQARRWVATLNAFVMAFSVLFFLATAALTTLFAPGVFSYAVLGLSLGCALGIVGLWWTRWEMSPGLLRYTPNRWLVLAITVVVAGRIAYGFWRAWHAWQTTPEGSSWMADAGLGGSIAAGAVVLGYQLAFWTGVRKRLRPSSFAPRP